MGGTGKEINRPIDECRKKMENLLSSLRREKMKMRKSSGTVKVSTSNLNIYVLWQCVYFIVR
jgi:hypothetical protein